MKQKHEQLMAKLKKCQEMHLKLKEEADELEGSEIDAWQCHMQLHQCESQLLLAEAILAGNEIAHAMMDEHVARMHQPARQVVP